MRHSAQNTTHGPAHPIQLHIAHALQRLGTLYGHPADALKEHVSNAIDEHLKRSSKVPPTIAAR